MLFRKKRRNTDARIVSNPNGALRARRKPRRRVGWKVAGTVGALGLAGLVGLGAANPAAIPQELMSAYGLARGLTDSDPRLALAARFAKRLARRGSQWIRGGKSKLVSLISRSPPPRSFPEDWYAKFVNYNNSVPSRLTVNRGAHDVISPLRGSIKSMSPAQIRASPRYGIPNSQFRWLLRNTSPRLRSGASEFSRSLAESPRGRRITRNLFGSPRRTPRSRIASPMDWTNSPLGFDMDWD